MSELTPTEKARERIRKLLSLPCSPACFAQDVARIAFAALDCLEVRDGPPMKCSKCGDIGGPSVFLLCLQDHPEQIIYLHTEAKREFKRVADE